MGLEADDTAVKVHSVAAAFLRCRTMPSRHFGPGPLPLTEQICRESLPRALHQAPVCTVRDHGQCVSVR